MNDRRCDLPPWLLGSAIFTESPIPHPGASAAGRQNVAMHRRGQQQVREWGTCRRFAAYGGTPNSRTVPPPNDQEAMVFPSGLKATP